MNLLMVIFGLVAIFGAVGTVQAIKEKNLLGIVFNVATFAIFAWFTVMTIWDQGYPPSLH
ncbi:MAG: DUF2759 domain-containing protein [Paenisporosarcina sp.]